MKSIFVLLFICLLGSSHAQNSLDELKVKLKEARTEEEIIHTTINISYVFSRSMPDSGLVYAQRGLEAAQELGLKYEVARSNSALSINYLAKADYKLALEFQTKALQLFDELDSSKQMAGSLANISLIYLNQSNYKQALDNALKALAVYDEVGDESNKAILLENIGTIFFRQNDFERAKSYYEQAYLIYEKEDNTLAIARNRGNMGMVFSRTGLYDEAEKSYLEALALNRKLGNKRSEHINLGNLGLLEYRRGHYDKALRYYDTTLTMTESTGAKLDYAACLGNIGEVYVKMATQDDKPDIDLLDKGIDYLGRGINGCITLNSVDPAVQFYPILSEAYSAKGDYKSALEAYMVGENLKDSLHSEQNKISIQHMIGAQELEIANRDLILQKRELKIKELELNKSRQTVSLYIMGLVILLLVGLVSVLMLRRTRLKNRRLTESNAVYASKIEDQLESLMKHATVLDEITYMQAHHVREPVSTILGMVEHFNVENPNDPINLFIIENLSKVAQQLDVAVREVINKKEEVHNS